MLTLLDSARHAKTKWPLRQICHNGQWKASSSNAQQYELLLRFCVKHSNKTDQLRAFKALMCAFGKDEVPGSNPGISSISLAEMQDFFVVLGWFLQEPGPCLANCKISLLIPPFLSHQLSHFSFRKSPVTQLFQGFAGFRKCHIPCHTLGCKPYATAMASAVTWLVSRPLT